MAFESEFAQILEKKIEKSQKSDLSSSKNEEKKTVFHNPTTAFFLDPYSWKPQKTSSFYRKKRRKKPPVFTQPPEKRTAPLPKEPTLLIENLHPESQKILRLWNQLGASFAEEINTKELKTSYRMLLKKFHPDLSGQPKQVKTFLFLQETYPKIKKSIETFKNTPAA